MSVVAVAEREEKEAGETSFRTAELGLPGILRIPYLERLTGLLHFDHEDQRLSLRFVNGEVVSALSSSERWRLGESLVRRGVLGRADLERALAAAGSQGRRLGPVLRELGLLAAAEAEEAVAGQVREVLAEIASWPDASWSFERQEPPVPSAEDLTLGLPTADLIVEAVRQLPGHAVLRCLGSMERRLVPSADSWARSRRVSLSPAAAYLLSRVDGSLTARQVLAISPFEEAQGLRTLLGLLCSGTIAFASAAGCGGDAGAHPFRAEVRAAFAGLRTRTPHEILGVRPSASLDEIRAAYARLARRFHPDVLHDPAMADLRDELHAVFVRIGEAYNQLRSAAAARVAAAAAASTPGAEPERPVTANAPAASDAPAGKRASWDAETVAAVDPTETLRSAGRHFTARRYWDAIALAEPLTRSASGRVRRKARLLVARARGRNPKLAHDAEAELRALAAEDPSDGEVWQALGDVYLELGLPQRAASMFRRVQELRPRDVAAGSRPSALDTGARIVGRLLRKAEAAGAELLSGSRS